VKIVNLFLFLNTITVRSFKPVNSCANLSTKNLNSPGYIYAEVVPEDARPEGANFDCPAFIPIY
jgi:hypothetical protein